MKVAILGYGREGQAALRYWRERNADITVFDESRDVAGRVPKDVTFKGGKGSFDDLHGFDVVVRWPGIHPDRIKTDGKITSVTKLFFEHCPAPIIGVTGSKGKGTVSSLIFEMLTHSGVRAHLAGNIGVAALDILPDVRHGDVVVLELSSFQLWELEKSPHVAVVLMIEPDHMDVHKSMDEYVSAKANITKHQTNDDIVIFHPSNKYAKGIAGLSKGHKMRYMHPPAAHVKQGNFVINEQKICSTSDLLLPGFHNIENACAAITAAWQYTQDVTAIRETLKEFGGLDHRLKFVKEVHGVKYFDDSIATTPGSAIAAVNAFKQPKVLILGGSSKGANFTELAQSLKTVDMRWLLLMGDEAEHIAAALEAAGVDNYDALGKKTTMDKLVKMASEKAKKGDVVILSPACASFGMFKNYQDRGQQFIKSVEAL